MQVCTSLQTDNPTTLFLQARCPSCRPTNSIKAPKANKYYETTKFKKVTFPRMGVKLKANIHTVTPDKTRLSRLPVDRRRRDAGSYA